MSIELSGIRKSFGNFAAVDDVDLHVETGELLALLGPVGFVAGAFDGELGGPPDSPMPVGDLVGGGQCQRDLVGVQRIQ